MKIIKGQLTSTVPGAAGAYRVGTDALPGATFGTVQDLQLVFHSAAWADGGTITDAGGETFTVDGGKGLIRTSDSSLGLLAWCDWEALGATAIPTDSIRYVGVEYSGGIAQVAVRTTYNWNFNTDWPLGVVVNEGGILHIQNAPHAGGDHANFMIQRTYETMPLARANRIGGLILGETGTRNVTLTAGAIWERLQKFNISAIDTSSGGTFVTYYRDGVGGWTLTTGVTQWPNTQYDDGSGTLATLTNNRYMSLWFYIELDGTLVMVYGQNQWSTITDAETEGAPSTVPTRVSALCKLVGRIIIQKNATTATEIQSAFDTSFEVTPTSDHGNLAGLTDDDHTQYHTDARGDARYYTQAVADATFISEIFNAFDNASPSQVVSSGTKVSITDLSITLPISAGQTWQVYVVQNVNWLTSGSAATANIYISDAGGDLSRQASTTTSDIASVTNVYSAAYSDSSVTFVGKFQRVVGTASCTIGNCNMSVFAVRTV